MNPISLDSNQLFWLGIVSMICALIGWCASFIVLRNNVEQLKALLLEGNLIRILTVIAIAVTTTFLALVGILEGIAVATLFGGIVGYVLGSWR